MVILYQQTFTKEMKKLIAFALGAMFLFIGVSGQAQTIPTRLLSTVVGKTTVQAQMDTVANTATKSQKVAIAKRWQQATIQVVLRTITGTPAGKVILLGSLDGTTFAQVKTDSLMVGAAALSKLFTISQTPYNYYQLSYTGSGTMSVEMKSLLTLKL